MDFLARPAMARPRTKHALWHDSFTVGLAPGGGGLRRTAGFLRGGGGRLWERAFLGGGWLTLKTPFFGGGNLWRVVGVLRGGGEWWREAGVRLGGGRLAPATSAAQRRRRAAEMANITLTDAMLEART